MFYIFQYIKMCFEKYLLIFFVFSICFVAETQFKKCLTSCKKSYIIILIN